jgi:acetolactate synthase-1/2/3 large subunit
MEGKTVAEINGGRLVARMLKQEGVEYLFALSGGHIDPIFQGCLDEGIRVIDVRHEQVAVFMAEGWAWVTGKPGVAAVTAGPGITNAVTGLWNALGKASPIVVFGGRSPMREFEWGSLQDMDSLSLVQTVTKWARAGYETKRIAEYVSMAFRQAMSGRPGPTYLEFPIDILAAKVEESEVTMPANYRTTARTQGDPVLVKEAVDLLLGAKRPMVIAGSGVWWSQASSELREFAELTSIPVNDGIAGEQGSIPADNPLHLKGMAGMNIADAVLLMGARLDFRRAYGRPPLFSEDSKWIQVDIEPTEIGRNRPIDIGIVGDAKAVLRQMIDEARDRCQGREELPWVNECQQLMKGQQEQLEGLMNSDDVPIHPARLCREIRDFLDRDATIIVDGGEISGWGFRSLRSYEPGHFLGVTPTGTLGIGTAYAMAARLARPGKQVLLLSGDGSFGLNAMEFDTMVRHQIPIVSVISNDGAWGMILREQKAKGTNRIIGTELGFVRYDKVVEALGGYGEAVEKPEDIRPAIERAFASGLPACVNVRVIH